MKGILLVSAFFIAFLSACGGNQPLYADNGNPGRIKAVFFYDDNHNGQMDGGESVLQAQQIAGISQEVSCPPSGTPIYQDSNANGVIEFDNLKPGKYCLALNNGFLPTTRMDQEVYVSSDQVTAVYFGIARP